MVYQQCFSFAKDYAIASPAAASENIIVCRILIYLFIQSKGHCHGEWWCRFCGHLRRLCSYK